MSGTIPYIVGVGIACVDYLVVAPKAELGAEVSVEEFAVHGGGLTGTALAAASRLGVRTAMLGTLGDDAIGDEVVRGLREDGVDTRGIIRVPGGRSLFSLILVDLATAERTIYSRGDAGLDCEADLLDLGLLHGADVLLMDPHWPEGAWAATRRARDLGVPVVCDMRLPSRHIDHLKLCDYPILSRLAARELSGSSQPAAAIEMLLALGARAAVVTCGERGAFYAEGGEMSHVPAFEVEAVDTTGAGDVFHGAFAVGLAYGWSIRDCVVFASAVSAINCTALGGRTGIPSFEQTVGFLAARGITLPRCR